MRNLDELIIAALTYREYWNRFGEEVQAPNFFRLYEARKCLSAISIFWKHYKGTEDLINIQAIRLIIEQHTPKQDDRERINNFLRQVAAERIKVEEFEPAIITGIGRKRGRQILIKATENLENPDFNPDELAYELGKLGNVLHPKNGAQLGLLDICSVINEEKQLQKYPTGLIEIDRRLNGGIWGEEVGFLAGHSTVGKTHVACYLSGVSLLENHPVIYIPFEISPNKLIIRLHQGLLKKDRDFVEKNPGLCKELIQELGVVQPLKIIDHRYDDATCHQLRREILVNCESLDKPPLIIIDSIDLVTPSTASFASSRWSYKQIAEEVRKATTETKAAAWCCYQTNKETFSGGRVRMQDSAESLHPARAADIFIGLNFIEKDTEVGLPDLMGLNIDKARERNILDKYVQVEAIRKFQWLKDYNV